MLQKGDKISVTPIIIEFKLEFFKVALLNLFSYIHCFMLQFILQLYYNFSVFNWRFFWLETKKNIITEFW